MTTENKPRTLEELIAKHHGETVEYSNAELIASLIDWGRAERRAERELCVAWLEKEWLAGQPFGAVLAIGMRASLPDIEGDA